jgi:hypothetical protein
METSVPNSLKGNNTTNMLRINRFNYLLIKTDPFFILPFSNFNI